MGVEDKENVFHFTESDCCGNGCVNCVLDTKPFNSNQKIFEGKLNIIQNYTKFQLKSKKLYNKSLQNVLELHFSCSDAAQTTKHILDIPPGYHIMMRIPNPQQTDNDTSEFLLRPYSPFWLDSTKLEFKVLVDLSPNGPMSHFIKSLKDGDEVEFRGPIGKFEHESKNPKTFVIITQGIAITSAYRIINSILRDEEDFSKIHHICCFKDLLNSYFRDDIYEFNKFWNYNSHIYLSRQMCNNSDCLENGRCLNWCENMKALLRYKERVVSKRLDPAELIAIIQNFKLKGDVVFVISGSRDFQDNISDTVKSLEATHFSNFNIHLL